VLGVAALLFARGARATYSMVVVDAETRQMGVAVASCVPLKTVRLVAGLVRGRGAFVTQSYLREAAHAEAEQALTRGDTADDVLAALTAIGSDPDRDLRQIAVVTLAPGAATFTGPRALPYAQHGTYREGKIVATVQGNLLSGGDVLRAMGDTFAATSGDTIDRLVEAFEAPSRQSPLIGDARCLASSRSAIAATLDVIGDDPNADLHIAVGEESGPDPLPAVRAAFEAYRAKYPARTRAPAPTPEPALPPPPGPPPGAAGCMVMASHAPDPRAFGWLLVAFGALVARRRR